MKSQNNIIKFSYRVIINALINYLLLGLMVSSLEVDLNLINKIIIIGSSLVFIAIWRLIFKKPIISVLLIFGLLSALIAYMNFLHSETYKEILMKINDFISWSFRFLSNLTFMHPEFFNLLLIVLIFLLSFVTSTLVFNKKGIFPLVTFGTLIFLYRWFMYSDIAMLYYIFYITLILMLHSFNRYFIMEKRWEKHNIIIDSNILKRWIIYSVVISMVIVLIPTMTPRNFEPITWRWLDKRMQNNFPFLTDWRNSKKTSYAYGEKMKFDLSNTNFQEDYKRLGGPVEQKKVLVMKVKSSEPLYLKGRVKDIYTGSYWKSTDNNFKNEVSNTTNSLYKEVEGESNWVRIQHENLITSSIFSTYIPKIIQMDKGTYNINDEGEIFADKLMLRDKPYSVHYVKPYIDWNVLEKSSYISKEGYDKYLQLPKNLPIRVRKLSEDITRNIEGDYNKVEILKEYLKNSFEYTLTPPETPYNKDFVDYFLFDLKKGYCTYFASSLTVMARSIGIPARYVEGFKVSKEVEDGQYEVYSTNGHAWAEVYIEGYGWMVFEATPGFTAITYSEKKEEVQTIKEDENSTVTNSTGDRNRLGEMEDLFDIDIGEGEEELVDIKGENRFSIVDIIKYLFIFIILVIIGLLSIAMYNNLRIRKILKAASAKNNSKVVISYYRYIMNMLELIGFEKLDAETPMEYSNRLKIDLLNSGSSFMGITKMFNKARYSGESIRDDELLEVRKYLEYLEGKTRDKFGNIKFIYYKYIKMNIYN